VASPADVAFAVVGIAFLLILLILFHRTVQTIRPYEQGVVTIFGSYRRLLNPGVNLVSPLAVVVRVDLRSRSETLVASNFLTRSSVPVTVGGRVDYHVTDPAKATFMAQDLAGSVRNLLRDSVALSLAPVAPESALASGWAITEAVRRAMEEPAGTLGVSVDRVALSVLSHSGPVEFVAGRPTAPPGMTPPAPLR
jgi:regulator of protease activity HflC (stomatin/prohibitin superfamily)